VTLSILQKGEKGSLGVYKVPREEEKKQGKRRERRPTAPRRAREAGVNRRRITPTLVEWRSIRSANCLKQGDERRIFFKMVARSRRDIWEQRPLKQKIKKSSKLSQANKKDEVCKLKGFLIVVFDFLQLLREVPTAFRRWKDEYRRGKKEKWRERLGNNYGEGRRRLNGAPETTGQ